MRYRLAAAPLALLGLLAVARAEEAVQGGTVEDGGVRVTWRYAADGGGAAAGLGMLDVYVADAAAQAPLRYDSGRLAAWMQRRRGTLSDGEIGCPDKVRLLATQGIGRRAEIDLNAYRLMTLNTDGTLAFINPFVGLNNAKLESIVELGGVPAAWLHRPERMEAWVVLTQPTRLLMIDLHARQISRVLDLPPGGEGAALAWDAARQQLWAGLVGLNGLGVLQPDVAGAGLRLVETAPPLALWSDAQGRLPGVVSLHAGTVALHDGAAPPRQWPVAGTPRAVRYSSLARRLIVATEEGVLDWIDPEADDAPARRLFLGHSVRAMELFDEGRRALVLGGGRASVVDLASADVSLRLDTVPEAEEIAFTGRFAYAVSTRAGRASLWSLADLRAGRAQPVEVMLGRGTPGAPGASSGIPRTVPDPSGTGLLAANPLDGMIYQYGEGMMAPIGSYSNYRRAAAGLMLLDLSLREVSPGHYRGTVRHTRGGSYELVLSGVGPRFAACAPLVLAPTSAAEAAPDMRLRAELAGLAAAEGGAGPLRQTVRVRLHRVDSPAAVAGVPDLTLLIFDRRSGWQARAHLHETVEGEYQAHLAVPGPAQYELLASSPSRNLSFAEGRIGSIRLGAAP